MSTLRSVPELTGVVASSSDLSACESAVLMSGQAPFTAVRVGSELPRRSISARPPTLVIRTRTLYSGELGRPSPSSQSSPS